MRFVWPRATSPAFARLFHSMYVHAHAKLLSREEPAGNHQVGRNFNELANAVIRLPKQFAIAFCGP